MQIGMTEAMPTMSYVMNRNGLMTRSMNPKVRCHMMYGRTRLYIGDTSASMKDMWHSSYYVQAMLYCRYPTTRPCDIDMAAVTYSPETKA